MIFFFKLPLFSQFSNLLLESSLNFLFTYFKPVILFQKHFLYSPKKLVETLFLLMLLTVLSPKFTSVDYFLSHNEKG